MWTWATFFSSKGRIGRKRFWAVIGVLVGAMIVTELVAMSLMGSPLVYIFVAVLLVLIVASLNNQIKRIHDLGASGWWLLIPIGLALLLGVLGVASSLAGDPADSVPFSGLNSLVMLAQLIVLGAMPGKADDNRFGPSPVRPPMHDETAETEAA